ncbi:MAG: 4Fe-4S binding protein [Candidatus Gastranaerophilales bacterium]|nr:4Fe-4S binding protein [Candidatus Gastranaerophilales bacterium]
MNKEKVIIKTLIDNNRMSTQELLQLINEKIKEGYTDFDIEACGQHNIGGSSWAKDRNDILTFKITNPGQRVGAMALAHTKIIVEGSAPADVGWLNSGAKIVVNGDCGDTAAHCAAGGKIYVSGRVGTRSGALMKHDPKFDLPEFWVLKNTGSFGFEFMGGGIAVICGWDCDKLDSVLGSRSCVGMVGGTIYVRGPIKNIAPSVYVRSLEDSDIEFLKNGMVDFLKELNKSDLYDSLTKWEEWKKIVPLPNKKNDKISVKEFREKYWIENGIFGDFIKDDFKVFPLPASGEGRIHIPHWNSTNCVDCKICLNNCPQEAITTGNKVYSVLDDKCIGCGICEAVCPKGCWTIISERKEIM